VTGTTVPSAVKTWVIPIFLPSSPFIVQSPILNFECLILNSIRNSKFNIHH
jgi:hypothetical protein